MIQLSLTCLNHPDLLPDYGHLASPHCLNRPSMLPLYEHETQAQFASSKSPRVYNYYVASLWACGQFALSKLRCVGACFGHVARLELPKQR